MQLFNERQFFERYTSKLGKQSVAWFGFGCLLLGAISFGELSDNDFTALIPVAFYLTIGTLLFATRKWAISLAGTVYSFAHILFFIQLCTSSSMGGRYAHGYGVGHNFFVAACYSWLGIEDMRPALAICAFLCLVVFILGIRATLWLYQSSEAYLVYLESGKLPKAEGDQ